MEKTIPSFNMENTNLPKTAHKNWEIQLMFFYTICVRKRQFQVLTRHKQFLMSKYQFYINQVLIIKLDTNKNRFYNANFIMYGSF